MDADERRQYLDNKLAGKLSDEHTDRIAAAVSSRLEAARSTSEPESDDKPKRDDQPDSDRDKAETGAAASD